MKPLPVLKKLIPYCVNSLETANSPIHRSIPCWETGKGFIHETFACFQGMKCNSLCAQYSGVGREYKVQRPIMVVPREGTGGGHRSRPARGMGEHWKPPPPPPLGVWGFMRIYLKLQKLRKDCKQSTV